MSADLDAQGRWLPGVQSLGKPSIRDRRLAAKPGRDFDFPGSARWLTDEIEESFSVSTQRHRERIAPAGLVQFPKFVAGGTDMCPEVRMVPNTARR